ncbi:hypothetical protein AgCh_006946 [Apium graveolens]
MRNQKVLCDIKIDRNPRVFFDIDINGVHAGRMVMELFADTTPTAAEKFRALGIGENGIGNHGRPLHLKGSCITGSYGLEKYLEGGSDHRGKICCDELFEEEYYGKRHKGPGYLFFREEGTRLFSISLQETWHVVFGKIVDGMDVFRAIDSVNYAMERVKYSERTNPVTIVNCGQLNNKSIKHHNLKNYGPKYHNMRRVLKYHMNMYVDQIREGILIPRSYFE